MSLKERFQIVRPLEEMEVRLVRAACENPNLLEAREEALLRTTLSLARLYQVQDGKEAVELEHTLLPFREEVLRRFSPLLLEKETPAREELFPLLRDFREKTPKARAALLKIHRGKLSPEALDKELRQKALVLVSGGGGGTGYVYMGALSLLDEHGLRPSLMVGTSIGAIVSLFRSRKEVFDQAAMVNTLRALSWKKLFRAISTENRYGIPAALRLYLRAGVGRFFQAPRLSELPIPTIVAVSGIRRGMLPRPLEAYEQLFSGVGRSMFNPLALASFVQKSLTVLTEFLSRPEMLVKLHLGMDGRTWDFDALDAAGFSSALPGFIHYDVLREDLRMRTLLDGLFEEKGILRLTDGGLVDNLPAKAAWRAVHQGRIGTRNAFVLALNAFSMKLTTPLWLPLQRIGEITAKPNRPFAHLVKDFRRTLSPLELVPSVEKATLAIELGREQLAQEMPFIRRMLAPLPEVA